MNIFKRDAIFKLKQCTKNPMSRFSPTLIQSCFSCGFRMNLVTTLRRGTFSFILLSLIFIT